MIAAFDRAAVRRIGETDSRLLDLLMPRLSRHSCQSTPGRGRGPGWPRVLARSDSAGATHLFAAACRKEGWSSPSGPGR